MKNFRLKSSNFKTLRIVFSFALISLFVACQKENIAPNATINPETKDLSLENNENVKIDATLSLEDLDQKLTSNAREPMYVVYNEYISGVAPGFWNLFIKREDLPDPMTHRLEVYLIPHSGPADLYLQSFQENRNPQLGNIRNSRLPNREVDHLNFRQLDIYTHESHAVIAVRNWDAVGEFELKIYAVPVDCQEDLPRPQAQNPFNNPVCGCDGRNYRNKEEAINQGITSWVDGVCFPNVDRNIDGEWENMDFDFRPMQTIFIPKDLSSITIKGDCKDWNCFGDKVKLTPGAKKGTYEATIKQKDAAHHLTLQLNQHQELEVIVKSRSWDKKQSQVNYLRFKQN
jgi:hypothetical protein